MCLQLAERLAGAGWSRAASLTRLPVGSVLALFQVASLGSLGLVNGVMRKNKQPLGALAQKSDNVTVRHFIGQSKLQRLSKFKR